jgi:hypothetical protein
MGSACFGDIRGAFVPIAGWLATRPFSENDFHALSSAFVNSDQSPLNLGRNVAQ